MGGWIEDGTEEWKGEWMNCPLIARTLLSTGMGALGREITLQSVRLYSEGNALRVQQNKQGM